jgi:hypothetical protein
MIYVCVPVHDEAKTAGLVLWKVRQVFTTFPREYQLLVCNDASTDDTADVLAAYARVLPMEVVTHRDRRGYARSVETLLQLALERTDRAKRDCAIVLHADFVHSPDAMEDMVKRLESGADLVVAEQAQATGAVSRASRWARRLASRLLPVPGVRDTVSGFLALRLIVLRQALKQAAPGSLLSTDGWSANAELLARLAPHSRRTDTVASTARYDLRQRASRARPWDRLVDAWKSRRVIRGARVAALVLLAAASLRAQTDSTHGAASAAVTAAATVVPFPVGERMLYQANYGPFHVGQATMEVVGLDTIRGTQTVHLRFRITGGALWYHLDQTMESWVGRGDFRSRQFHQDADERGRVWHHYYNIFPDSGFYREEGVDSTYPTTADPLDDAAFLYWIRTVPLEVGKRYEYSRYFRPDRNPVIIQVLRRERVSIPAGKFNAIVVRPYIPKGRGILAEKSETQIYLSDDDRRMMLALVSTFSFGTVTLRLKEYSVPGRP